MSDVSSLQVFQDAALRSGLVTPSQWQQALAEVGEDPIQIGEHFVRANVLTPYQAQQLQAGRGKLTLGPYLITDWIAQGGMGQVFKAVHTVMGRPSAVKVLPLEKSTSESRKSFLREIRLQAGLDCPYLVRAFDAGHDGNVHYLVTEYVPGTDLRRMVRQQGRLTMQQAAGIVHQAALGLHYAHGLGLIHRDVKPGNILVTPEGRAKVSDVGLATWSMGQADDPRAGKIVGTADYLSPEQIRSPQAVHPASDIYSLGCTLYYAVTGKVPYPGGDSRSKCRRHLEETPWHPRRFAPNLDEAFVELIADMMEKDPQRRIDSAELVAQRLLPWCSGDAEMIPPATLHAPWKAAPSPAETAAMPEIDSRDSFSLRSGSGQQSGGHQRSSVASGTSVPLPAPYPPAESAPSPQSSNVMLIAWVLAIAIPISLLIGAILGFLVRAQM